ncbi:hypothetical protein XENOCAPTIV_024059 [Xenoophorus captivus]|uniref:Uncharacterized protein n=1 Tax=Xenoophorus captivus TaxID=1517983 RepID=A0ABV0R4M2_9TELE
MELVQLPCQVNVSVSMESTVVWSREDLRFSTVHIHQQSGDDLSEQNQRYSGRTMMKKDALRTGDLSLTLKSPSVSDKFPHRTWMIPLSVGLVLLFILAAVGLYVCTVQKDGHNLKQKVVSLFVQG